MYLQIQTVVKKVEIEPEYDDTNSTLEDFLSGATKPPPIFKEKKSLQYKSGMNVLGMEILGRMKSKQICFSSEYQCHYNLSQV